MLVDDSNMAVRSRRPARERYQMAPGAAMRTEKDIITGNLLAYDRKRNVGSRR
jgi:hypothetical protein